MPTLVITNSSSAPIYLRDLYVSLAPSISVTTYRSYSQLASMAGLNAAIRAGVVTVVYTETDDELAMPGHDTMIYGDGAQGVGIFDGIATYSYATLNGSTYTLTRDVFLDGSTTICRVNSGITLYTAGYKAFVQGTLLNNGLIHNDGKDAVNGTAGGSSALGTLGIGVAGGNGRANNTGVAGSNQSNMLQGTLAAGGAGGAGGVNAGGSGGTYAGGSSGNGGANFLLPYLTGFMFSQTSGGNQASVSIIGGGAGGGGGGSNNAGVTGGGGGGGGGVMLLHVYNMINNGIIRTRGGAGAAASGAGGDGGGGGGGGGGMLYSMSRFRSGSGVFSVAGGAGGAAVGAGVAGSSGGAGNIDLDEG